MLNQSILTALQERASQNINNPYKTLEQVNERDLIALRNEADNLCESIEYGLMHLGEMMQTLGYLADEDNDVTRKAISNDNAKHIGGLIKANAYLLNALRETAGLSEYYLAGGLNGEMKRTGAQ